MIVLDNGLALFHLPKTGGTWIERVAESERRVSAQAGQHDPAWMHVAGVPRVGTTRDPWSWYGSLYFHARGACEPAATALREYGGGVDDFKSVLRGLTHPTTPSPACAGLIWHPVAGASAALAASGVGLWTWAHRYFYGTRRAWERRAAEWAVDALLDQASLAAGVRSLGLDGSKEPPALVRDGPPYAEMYDAEMLSWVEEADGALATSLGYEAFRGLAAPVLPVGKIRPVLPVGKIR